MTGAFTLETEAIAVRALGPPMARCSPMGGEDLIENSAWSMCGRPALARDVHPFSIVVDVARNDLATLSLASFSKQVQALIS
ncbi:hypothetical protein RISK_000338 [Rhodopirellula islandica]|uniref:Uncharacterized protein n=1 Tax=Rhodopirellula islandica TaxID=595434 RepID=A0A0J1BMB4_RHOIS|nr:hypothetical protein RISK_000338 [Rhodopirellula islandica]